MDPTDYGRGFACRNVWEKHAPILYVSRDSEGDWQFLCGGNEHTSAKEARLIHAIHAFDLFPNLNALRDLGLGESARRESPEESWVRYREADPPP
jgi:hypothetical protein